MQKDTMLTKRAKLNLFFNGAEKVFSNDDLLREILVRVPATSLGRFKTVSKQWLSIISDGKFVSDHVRLNPKPSGMYTFRQTEFLNAVPFSGHTVPTLAFLNEVAKVRSELGNRSITVADSCNGLLLCWYNYYNKSYLVCNPTTKNFNLLPTPPHDRLQFLYHHSAVLVFEPWKSTEYNVVLVNWDASKCPLDLYSSSTKSWKRILLETSCLHPCVYWEGDVQWTTCNKEKRNIHCRFNVEIEELEVITLPSNPIIHSADKFRYFGVCGGSLLLIQSHKTCAVSFNILEMGSGQSCWAVKCQVRLGQVIPEGVKGVFSVAHVLEGGNKQDLELVIAVSDKMVSYNTKSKKLKDITDLTPAKKGFKREEDECRIRGFQFVESLARVSCL